MRCLFLLGFLLMLHLLVNAQDSSIQSLPVPKQDSVLQQPVAAKDSAVDSLHQQTKAFSKLSYDSCRNYILQKLSKINITSPGLFVIQQPKVSVNKDWLFYYLLGLLLLFGAIRLTYSRYFSDLFRFFFRTSLKVNQIKEQLVQSGLQSLLFNLFFALAFGMYVYLLSVYFKSSLQVPGWMVPVGASLSIMLLYLGKYLFLKLSGWLFSMSTATDTYTFIVFLINKVAGVAILPFIVIIAFASAPIAAVTITLSLVMVVGLFLYRFLRAYQPVQTAVKVSRLHFFIFFLAFEIAPLLLIYKVLIRYF
ncbi:MAG: DUF4271 domain-containing protein [Chitinophagaceae bacterium]|nr:DUF4271 domain-containing protein [Chitinophagaceae bacterium]